ncbi:hypothetical protein [Streptomyces sp. GESEQ-4]|uniref:hypothetical protein n=1 Tax=Streptomyces sp. GESEQ-4 TaxID=2812655 RepID=UPI001B31E30C|nr:hypothetical protein [Streptomyces sp. GESEQ-4]
MSSAEIAALAQVQRPVVTTWARRHDDFPHPVARGGSRLMYDGGAVLKWLLRTGRGNAPANTLEAELALHTLTAGLDFLSGMELVEVLTALICLQHHDGGSLTDSDAADLVERARFLDPDDTFLLREIERAASLSSALPLLTRQAESLIEGAYNAADALDWILDARRRLHADDLAVTVILPNVATCMARLATAHVPDTAAIANPDCGVGDLLAAAQALADVDDVHTYLASDRHESAVRLTRRRILVRGVFAYGMDIARGDLPPLDSVDAHTPVALLGTLPYAAAESRDPGAALERVGDLVGDIEGPFTAVILGPADAFVHPLAAHGAADRLRRTFLTGGRLKAVVNLPGGVLPYYPGYRTALWVLSYDPGARRTGRVLTIDLSGRELTPAVLDALVEDVDVWRESGWRGDIAHDTRAGAILAVADLDRRPGFPLIPQGSALTARYSRQAQDRPVRIAAAEVRYNALADRARTEHETVGPLRVRTVARPDGEGIRRTTVGALVRAKRLRKVNGHRIAAEHLTAQGHYPVIGAEEVAGVRPVGSRRIDRDVFIGGYEYAAFTEPGDIVVTENPSFGAYVDEQGLSVVAFPARILRIREDAERPLQPRALAALLRTAAAENRRTPGAVRAARKIEEYRIPELAPGEAAAYEATLADIARRAALLREQAAALEDLDRLTAAGIADGTLTIHTG